MTALSNKSDQEIGWLLDDYGIKHGPVVESTRNLYEKKLKEAMAKEERSKPHLNISTSHKKEDTSYTSHRKPMSYEGFAERRNPAPRYDYRELDAVDEPIAYSTQASYRSTSRARYSSSPYETQREEASSPPSTQRIIPVWLQILFFLIMFCGLVLVLLNMEGAPTMPFKRLT